MSAFNLDNPGFESPSATPPAPPSSGSSSDAAADGTALASPATGG